MKGKVLFVVGLGVGYVLGARAGRARYEQIRKAAENVWNQPAVQQGVDTVKDFAMTRVGDLSDTVLDGVKNLVGNATKASSTKSGESKSASSNTAASKSGSSKASAAKASAAKPSSKPSASDSSSSGSGSSAASDS
jgi:hypothetical protein